MKQNTKSPRIFTPFTPKEIRPGGWLEAQLGLQAQGLSGHLHEIWPDVRDSKWIGGEREGWERVPYACAPLGMTELPRAAK